MESPSTHLFVYGTLQPGDVRWHHLAPFVVDEGCDDAIAGRLFDTGLNYPAAILDDRADPGGIIVGRTYPLLESSLSHCLTLIDAEESSVDGEYRRVEVTTQRGIRAHVYEYGGGLDLSPIPGGNWLLRDV